MKRFLLSVALLLACSGVAFAQESEFSGGGGGGVSTAGGSGTAGVIPAFVSASSLEDSKMTTSGTNKGTWTLYDSTAVTGVTSLVVRAGAAGDAWATKLVDIRSNANASIGGFVANSGTLSVWTDDIRTSAGDYFIFNGSAYNALQMNSAFVLKWSSSGASSGWDIGLARSAAGILAVTEGSTGQGGIGLSDAATNTVTDALILRHATSGTATTNFGTGLLFQGEDAAGNMQDMASIDAVYTDATNGSEDADLKFYGMDAGTKTLIATFTNNDGAGLPALIGATNDFVLRGASSLHLVAGGTLYLYGAGSVMWGVNGTTLYPYTTNTYDIGTSSAVVREIFGRALTSDLNLVLGAGNVDQIVMGSTYFGTTGSAINTLNLGYVGAEFASAYVSTSIQGATSVTLTAATDDPFVEIAVPVGGTVGGYVEYTIVADDATDYQSRSGILPFTVVNKGGTESAAIGTPGAATEAFAESAGGSTLTNTFTTDNATGSNNVRIRANVVSSLTETTLAIKCRVVITSGTATLTFNP